MVLVSLKGLIVGTRSRGMEDSKIRYDTMKYIPVG